MLASQLIYKTNRTKTENHKAKKSYKEKEQHQDHSLRTVSRINLRGGGGGDGGGGGVVWGGVVG